LGHRLCIEIKKEKYIGIQIVYLITSNQQTLAIQALDLWGSVSTLNFMQSTTASASDIINIGTGSLAPFGYSSGSGGVLGLGGGIFSIANPAHNNPEHHSIDGGIAWMDVGDNWDNTFNGSDDGTFDWFTVAMQEIGHALGLDHTDDIFGTDMMDGSYSGEQTILSASDIEHITSLYGTAVVVPIPPAVWLFGSGLLGLVGIARRKQSV